MPGSRIPRCHYRRLYRYLLAIGISLGLLAAPALALNQPVASQDYKANQMLVALSNKPGKMTISTLASKLKAKVLYQLPQIKGAMLQLPAGKDSRVVSAVIRQLPEVRVAEPNYIRRALALAPPDDPAYNTIDFGGLDDATYYQWDLYTIDALEGWAIWPGLYYTSATKPSDAIKVAVIDTGQDPYHYDFINAGGSSTDALEGGQLDITDSANLISYYYGDFPGYEDGCGHGTHVAGTIAAATNNGQSYLIDGGGMAGIGYNGQIMALKVLDDDGYGTTADVVRGIIYAADHGAKVLNLSLGGDWYSQIEQDAVTYAWNHGAIVICAAGNDAWDWPSYPAGYSRAMSVSATTVYDTLASYSNYGEKIAISAPGGDTWGGLGTWSTMPTYEVTLNWEGYNTHYDYLEGTSMATPHVAGLATLYAGYRKDDTGSYATPLEIYQAIQRGADDMGAPDGGWDQYFGYGRINVYSTMAGINTRGSTVGGVTGQALYQSEPACSALITATPTGGGDTYYAFSSCDDGCYRLANLPEGTYDLTAYISTETGEKSITVPAVEVTAGCDNPGVELSIEPLPPGGAITGVISWKYVRNTGPLENANIWVRRQTSTPGNWIAKTTSDYYGEYVINNLAAGSYYMQVASFGYRSRTVSLTVTTGGTTWSNLTLTR